MRQSGESFKFHSIWSSLTSHSISFFLTIAPLAMVTDSELIACELSFSFSIRRLQIASELWAKFEWMQQIFMDDTTVLNSVENAALLAQPVYQVLSAWPRSEDDALQPFSAVLLIRNMRHFVLKWSKYNVPRKILFISWYLSYQISKRKTTTTKIVMKIVILLWKLINFKVFWLHEPVCSWVN